MQYIYIWNIIKNIYVCVFVSNHKCWFGTYSYPLLRIAFKLSIEIWKIPIRMFDKGWCSGHRKYRIDLLKLTDITKEVSCF